MKTRWFSVLALFLVACGKSSGDSAGSSGGAPVPTEQPKPAQTAAKPPPPTTAAAPATTAAPAVGAMGPDGLPAEIPSTRSPVPSVAEWTAAREITVRKSTPLGCETKMVREWLRVSCKGKNDAGGTPLDVKKVAGCGADTFLFSANGTTSLVTPVLKGSTCDAAFSWTMGAHQLWVRWPNGAARPTIAFQG